jgi:8-oxo-dGTP pyrophosphatase MutT (NUDIX family)
MQHAEVTPLSPFTVQGFRDLAARTLHASPPPAFADASPRTSPSDYDLNPDAEPGAGATQALRPAAVLVPVVARPELTVLLTLRTEHLPSHAGQIAFPGGKVDPDDPTPIATALREAEEEVGLDPRLVEPIGFLDVYRTGTGFRILPVVALVQPDYQAAPNPEEVADVFEVPLAFLMDAANHRLDTLFWRGKDRTYHAMPFGDRYIWGATAGMLKNMHTRLFPS